MYIAPHQLVLEIVMVIVCNYLFGSMGYICAMHDFDNLVIAMASLMEPVVAELMALPLGGRNIARYLGMDWKWTCYISAISLSL